MVARISMEVAEYIEGFPFSLTKNLLSFPEGSKRGRRPDDVSTPLDAHKLC